MIQQSKMDRIKELVELLNKAGKSYYSEGRELMSNYEYDALYDELGMLEKETGYILSNSPTVNVGYEVLSELPKERHESPMLSLDKTKSPEALAEWLGSQKGLLSWKIRRRQGDDGHYLRPLFHLRLQHAVPRLPQQGTVGTAHSPGHMPAA